jgi:hypothetical protein
VARLRSSSCPRRAAAWPVSGTTEWTSCSHPRFDWPPPPILDSAPYDIITESAIRLTLRSKPDNDFGFQVEKRFDVSEHGLAIEFSLTNIWSHPQVVAPWQVTRAPRTGVLAWASGQQFHDADRLQKQDEDPGCWFLHSGSTAAFEGLEVGGDHSSIVVPAVSATSKLFTDARGWLAHAHHATLFLRIFPDLAPDQAAPRQAEVELYFNAERDYIELENQGAFVTLAPGQSLTYPVEWRFARLAAEVPTDRLTQQLLAAIHSHLDPLGPHLEGPE